ncbi:predicted protein [Lichtheimia corymbifera JMRC:FSU:9682]|uniref:Uncharacterized protein n=1 Tax=Lichtheimia corymbifera JMRC:FSU:9682 TaxID=1263082 RepID=A0A068SFQ0_9FUNG|nr:predicted protein [Lichtheimia corymbifera JMRC:FSU:9682]
MQISAPQVLGVAPSAATNPISNFINTIQDALRGQSGLKMEITHHVTILMRTGGSKDPATVQAKNQALKNAITQLPVGYDFLGPSKVESIKYMPEGEKPPKQGSPTLIFAGCLCKYQKALFPHIISPAMS